MRECNPGVRMRRVRLEGYVDPTALPEMTERQFCVRPIGVRTGRQDRAKALRGVLRQTLD